MKSQLKLILLIIASILLHGCANLSHNNIPTKRILFVGNSLTYYNDVPAMVAEIYSVIDGHHKVETEMLAQGGYSIKQHLSNDIMKSTLEKTKYDIVILQDFGGWPLCSSQIDACASTSESLSKAIELVRSNGAQPIWFSTYHLLPELQHMLSKEAEQIAKSLNVELVDVGAAMLNFLIENNAIKIVLPDTHPNTVGSWITAVTIVRQMINRPIAESMELNEICRNLWQNSNLNANILVSEQKAKSQECDRLAPKLLQKIIHAVNKSI